MGGMAIPMPKIFTIFTTLSMASLALPGMSGFVAELIILLGIITNQKYLLITKILITFVTAIGMILTPIYSLFILRQMFYGYKLFNTPNSYFFLFGATRIIYFNFYPYTRNKYCHLSRFCVPRPSARGNSFPLDLDCRVCSGTPIQSHIAQESRSMAV